MAGAGFLTAPAILPLMPIAAVFLFLNGVMWEKSHPIPWRKPDYIKLAQLEILTGYADQQAWHNERVRIFGEEYKGRYQSLDVDYTDLYSKFNTIAQLTDEHMERLYGYNGRPGDTPFSDPLDLSIREELLPPVELTPKEEKFLDQNYPETVHQIDLATNNEIAPLAGIPPVNSKLETTYIEVNAEHGHAHTAGFLAEVIKTVPPGTAIQTKYLGGPPLPQDIERDIINMQIMKHKKMHALNKLSHEDRIEYIKGRYYDSSR